MTRHTNGGEKCSRGSSSLDSQYQPSPPPHTIRHHTRLSLPAHSSLPPSISQSQSSLPKIIRPSLFNQPTFIPHHQAYPPPAIPTPFDPKSAPPFTPTPAYPPTPLPPSCPRPPGHLPPHHPSDRRPPAQAHPCRDPSSTVVIVSFMLGHLLVKPNQPLSHPFSGEPALRPSRHRSRHSERRPRRRSPAGPSPATPSPSPPPGGPAAHTSSI